MATNDLESLWNASYERTRELLEPLDDEQAQMRVPATPDWTVRQLLAHMVGLDRDALNDEVDDELSSEWTQHHVDDRQAASMADILGEWEELAPQVRAALRDGDPDEVASLVVDAYVHEQDLRGALTVPGAREDGAVELSLGAFAEMGVGAAVGGEGPAPLELNADEWTTIAGEGNPGAALRAPSRFELMRVLGGRRSADQVRSMMWEGDPEAYLPHLSPFGSLRDDDLIE